MKTENYLLYILTVITFVGCNPNVVNLKTKACFDFSPSNDIKTDDTITFSNCSVNANYYYWDFGDGSYSYQKEPKHIFKSKQSYLVKLMVANRLETDTTKILESNSVSKSVNITIEDIVNLNYDNRNLPDLDVDRDGISDFKFYRDGGNTSTTYQEYTSIIPTNNYEIFVDTVLDISNFHGYFNFNKQLPKIFIFGDKISNNNSYTNEAIYLTYYFNQSLGLNVFNTIKLNIWIKDEIRYIGFRKRNGNITKIGWLKLKVLGYTNITLYSFKVPTETDSLLIDK